MFIHEGYTVVIYLSFITLHYSFNFVIIVMKRAKVVGPVDIPHLTLLLP